MLGLDINQDRDELRNGCENIELNNSISYVPQVTLPVTAASLMRAADVPIHAVDALVRRAPSLQKTHDAVALAVSINPADAVRLDLDDELTSVRVKQGESSAILKLIIDEGVPAGSAWIPMAVKGSELLGDPFGEVVIEKA